MKDYIYIWKKNPKKNAHHIVQSKSNEKTKIIESSRFGLDIEEINVYSSLKKNKAIAQLNLYGHYKQIIFFFISNKNTYLIIFY